MCIINVAGKENIALPQIETGNGFTAILKADGTVWMTGNEEIVATGTGGTTKNTDITDNNNTDDVGAIINRPQTNGARLQQIKINEAEYLTNVIKISSGNNHVLALTKDGEIYAWGKNENGQLGIGNNVTTYATKVVGEGGSSTLKRIVDISAGETGSTAVNEFGWIYVWGNGTNGEFGNGGTTSSNTPVKTVINHGISATIGEGHIIAQGQNGKLYTWGKNNAGQLGTGNTTNNTIVGKIADGITDITAGGNQTIVKDTEGNIYGTGQNTNGEIGLGTNTNVATLTKITIPEIENTENDNPDDVGAISNRPHVKYIKSGKTNTTILLNDGTVWSTGKGTNGELGNGTTENVNKVTQGLTIDTSNNITEEPLTTILMIGRNNGGLNTAVILENGDIYATGDNTYLQIYDSKIKTTNYYNKMEFICLDYADKEIEIDQTGYTIDKNKLKYLYEIINVYNKEEEKEIQIGEIQYEPIDASLIKVNQNGYITPLKKEGTTELKIKDKTNGYETTIKIIVKNPRLQDTDTVTYIYNIDDLVKFRDSVNAGNDYAGKTVYVMEDIDMSPACSETVGSWTPIGIDTTIFAGTFDGNYHTLSNLYFNSNNFNRYVGLFTQNNGTIQNLILNNVDIYSYKTGNNDEICVGGIAGLNNGSIINCGVNKGNVTAYNGTANFSYRTTIAGGITGISNAKVIACYNKADITCQTYNVIINTGQAQSYAGGIIGRFQNGNIENCYNTGVINTIGVTRNGGGIVGLVYANNGSIIKNSYNIGSMTGTATEVSYIGGIAGLNGSEYNTGVAQMSNSYCGTVSTYSQNYWNGSSIVPTTSGIVSPTENLKTYAPTLGTAYENDDFSINDGYPILWWEAPTIELNKKQAYIKTGENLQLSIVGAHCNVPVENLDNVEITDFTWKSSNEDIAAIDENGLVTGLKEGYTTIYGKHKEYENVNVMCIINVAGKENIALPQIETGNGFTAILKADGTVWMTGNEEIVATGTGGTTQNTDITDNNNTDDVGAIINRPQTNGARPQQIKINETEYLTNVIKISSGNNHVLALTKNGEVYAWGKNENGQLGIGNNITTYATKVTGEGGSSTLKRIVDISAGETGSTAVNEFGWVYVWGNGSHGEFGNGGTTSSNTPVKTVVNHGISATIGEGHVVALGQNGKLYTWGKNNAGQLGTGNTTNNTIVGKIADGITDITAGGNQTIIKDIEGNIYGTGQNTNGEIGLGTNTNVATLTKITIPEIENTENDNPDDVGAISNRPHVKYIKAGSTNTTIMLSDGTVWSTGKGTNGELGNGENNNTNTFVVGKYCNENISTTENDEEGTMLHASTEEPLTTVLMIGRNSGRLNTAVILENGSIYVTGDNTYLQITNETEEGTNYYVPMRYIGITSPEEIELQVGESRTITEEELEYTKDKINVYKQDQITIPLIDYTQVEDEKIATYEQGKIEALEVGTTKLKVENEEYDILFYIPVKVYGKIIGRITTENYEGKHIANVTLYKSGEDTKVIEAETKEDGTYEIKVYEPGKYDLGFTKLGYLDTKITEIEVEETDDIIEVEEQALVAGDVAESGEIEIDDLVDINDNYGVDITEENKEAKSIYDLNEDGKIDMLDRVILKKNYGRVAETVKWVRPTRRRRKMLKEGTADEADNVVEYNDPDVLTSDISLLTAQDGEVLLTRMEVNYLICPIACDYRISSNYGYRAHPTTGEEKLHAGIDLVGEHHTEILSIADGVVTYAGVQNGYGNCIEIKHIVNGETIYSFYAHLSKIEVKVGEKVKAGEIIGLEGGAETDPNHGTSTGHHLHFEIRTASGSGHSVNPNDYIEF